MSVLRVSVMVTRGPRLTLDGVPAVVPVPVVVLVVVVAAADAAVEEGAAPCGTWVEEVVVAVDVGTAGLTPVGAGADLSPSGLV